MAVWVSPSRPVVFGVIRNASRRKIHYCDYLLGYFEFVRVHARKSPSADWVPIPLKPVENRAAIGVLLCSLNDTLGPGREMSPNETSALENRSIRYTFDVDLRSYQFQSGWEGPIEFEISQTIFGGRHEDDYEGTIESPAFTVKLPFAQGSMSADHPPTAFGAEPKTHAQSRQQTGAVRSYSGPMGTSWSSSRAASSGWDRS